MLRERKEPKCLRTDFRVVNGMKIWRNQKIIGNENDDLEIKSYLKEKKKHKVKQTKIEVNGPSCKQRK